MGGARHFLLGGKGEARDRAWGADISHAKNYKIT